MVLLASVTVGVGLLGRPVADRLPIAQRAAATAHDLERLHAARTWLLMHAAHYDQRREVDARLQDMIGVLPCPDAVTDKTFDGQQAGFCSLNGRMHLTQGWLPERFIARSFVGVAADEHAPVNASSDLSSSPLRDHGGAPLWYAVAQSHRFGAAGPRNSDLGDALDDIEIDGDGGFVAILIAGGPAQRHEIHSASLLPAPDRACADGRNPHPLLKNSLEAENACFGNARYQQRASGRLPPRDTPAFNDLALGVSRHAFNAAIESRVMRTLSKIFSEADPGALPDLSPSASVLETQVAGTDEGACAGVPNFGPEDNAPSWLESEWLRHGMVLVTYGNGVQTRAGVLCDRTQSLAPAGVWSVTAERDASFPRMQSLAYPVARPDVPRDPSATLDAEVIIFLAGRALPHQVAARRRGDRRLGNYFELTLEHLLHTSNAPASVAAQTIVHAQDSAHNDHVAFVACPIEKDGAARFGCAGEAIVE